MQHGKRAAFAAVAVAACAGWAGWAWSTRAPEATVSHGAAEPKVARTPQRPRVPPLLPLLPNQLGLARAQALHYAMTADVDSEGQAAVFRVDGVLEADEARVIDGAAWQPLRVRGARLDANAVAVAVTGAIAEAALETPFLVRHEADGRVAELRFDPTVPSPARAVLASVAMAGQFARPQTPNVTSWTAAEQHLNGTFTASYARQADGSGVKERQSEPGRWPQLTATTRFRLDGERLASVVMEERGTFPLNDVARSHTSRAYRIDLSLQAQPPVASWQPVVQPASMVPWQQSERVAPASAKDARPPEVVLEALGRITTTPSVADEIALRDELSRGLRRHPEAVAQTLDALRLHTLHGDGERLAVAGLVGARTPEALQAASLLIADRRVLPAVRGQVMQAATLLEVPSPKLIVALRDVAFTAPESPLGGLAVNALGAQVAAQFHFGEADAAKETLAELLLKAAPIIAPATFGSGAKTEANLETRVAWISSLGNTRHPTALPILLAALREHEELVRAHAAFALRHQNPAACIDVMTEVMAKEPSTLVRGYLIDAARRMGPAVVQTLVEKALRFDRSESVRLAAVYALGVWSVQAPGVKKVLQDALQTESSMTVADAIKEQLAPGQSQAAAQQVALDPTKLDPNTLGVLP